MSSSARFGDMSAIQQDAHSCPSCPHSAAGPAVTGSSDAFINDRGALRVGDTGVHDACCGANTWTAVEGAPAVYINDRPVVRMGDTTQHCGGMGAIIEGSDDVFIGDLVESDSDKPAPIWAMTYPESTPVG